MSRKKINIASIGMLGVVACLGVTSQVMAERVAVMNTHSGALISVPEHVVEVAPDVFSLGTAIDPVSGKEMQGFMIVHEKEHAKRTDVSAAGKRSSRTACYDLMASGARWKSNEPWVYDPVNNEGLSEQDIYTILDGAVAKWEDAATGAVADGKSFDIFGTGTAASSFAALGVLDGVNGVRFGLLSDTNTIAVTSVWGIFDGRPKDRVLVEWDQVYNTYYTWSTDTPASWMDFESIVTHEIGHAFGLADLYQTECNQETMYGYGANGQIYARDLNNGDIEGISTLY